MSKDRAQFLAAERHKTKVGKQRKALAAIADAAVQAIKECDEGRGASACMSDLKRRVEEIQRELLA
mgnify:CR=1 FL=1